MEIPCLDGRGSSDIKKEIGQLAKVFVPEWNFNADHPDAGSCAAIIYSDMMSDVIGRFNRTAEKNMTEFFSRLGAAPLPPEPSEGYAVFGVSGGGENITGEYVKYGEKLTSAKNGAGLFTVTEPVYVINSALNSVFYEDGKNDIIVRSFEGGDGKTVSNIPVFEPIGENLQRHYLYAACKIDINFSERARFFLKINFDNLSDDIAEKFIRELVAGRKTRLQYGTGEGYRNVENCEYKDGMLYFSLNTDNPPAETEENGIRAAFFRFVFDEKNDADKIYISRIGVGAQDEMLSPDSVCDDMGQLMGEQFMPFGVSPVPYSSFYIASDVVLAKAGADVELVFTLNYRRTRIDEEISEETEWKHIMKRSKLKKAKEYDVSVAEVAWEYYNGYGWARLFKSKIFADVFSGKNGGDEINVEFRCPKDIRPCFLASGESYAVRVRIISVENFAKQSGWYITPVISNPRLSYQFSEPVSCETVISDNNMERKAYYNVCDSVRAAYGGYSDGRSMYFSFSAPLSKSDITILFVMKNSFADAKHYVAWEYLTAEGWKKLSCVDETNGLAVSGLLILKENGGFYRKTLFGSEGYWIRCRLENKGQCPKNTIEKMYLNGAKIKNIEIRDAEYFYVSKDGERSCPLKNPGVYQANVFVDEKSEISEITAAGLISKGLAEPEYDEDGKIYRLWIKWTETDDFSDCSNSERVYMLDRENSVVRFGNDTNGKLPKFTGFTNVKITYSTGGGLSGNLPADSITLGEGSIGLISFITNPVPTYGGNDRENTERTLARCAARLRSGVRACTPADYDNLIKEADRNILSVKTMSGINADLEREDGCVTAAVLFPDKNGFYERSGRMKRKIASLCCGGLDPDKFFIIRPFMVKYNISALLVAENREIGMIAAAEAEERLKKFFSLSPDTEIGVLPHKSEIACLLSDINGVVQTENIEITLYDEDGSKLSDADIEIRYGIAAPVMGEADITAKTKSGR